LAPSHLPRLAADDASADHRSANRLADSGSSTRRSLRPFLAYLGVFYSLWTLWVLYGYPRLQALGPRSLPYALANLAVRSALWIAPVVLYVRYVERRDPIDYLRLTRNWRRGVCVGLLFAAVNLAGSAARFGLPHVHAGAITWNTVLSTSLAIGLFEELPFRGLMLQTLAPRCGWLMANVLTSLLFVLIHVPGWVSLGTWRLATAFVIFVLGFMFGLAFRLSGSLWGAVIAHSTNDLFASVLFGL
jgi:membrane protease YdiL (CAAX protease family)